MGHYEELYQQFLDRRCSREEAERLLNYFRTEAGDAALVELIEARIAQTPMLADDAEEDPEDVRSVNRNRVRIFERIDPVRRRPAGATAAVRAINWLVAASVLVLLSIGAGIFVYTYQQRNAATQISQYGDEVEPGGNRATLTLADGRIVELSDAHAGIVVGNGIRYLDGSAVWNGEQDPLTAEGFGGDGAGPQSLTTPLGGQYHITLPDGSRVWLNAGSTLRYPASFDDAAERLVELSGEAYFEVVARERGDGRRVPFLVRTPSQTVEVLGTSFNISAYADDSATKTTLVEGAVQIVSEDRILPLAPGEQSLLSGGALTKQQVDVRAYTGWKDNVFVFHHLSLREVMMQLQRWYDIEVDLDGLPAKNLYGKISRDVPLSQVLAMIEEVSGISFITTGRRVQMVD